MFRFQSHSSPGLELLAAIALGSRKPSELYFDPAAVFFRDEDAERYTALSEAERTAMSPLLEDIHRHGRVALTYTGRNGRSIVARDLFAPGECIAELQSPGTINRKEILVALDEIQAGGLPSGARQLIFDAIQVDVDRLFLPTQTVGFLLNHSCAPNALLVDDGKSHQFRALRSILPGDQILWNYSTSIGDWYIMQCNCGSSSCCGVAASPLSLSQDARDSLLEQFGEAQLFPYIIDGLKSSECPGDFTAERFLEAFDGDDKVRVLTSNVALHPAVRERVRAVLGVP